MNYFRLLPFVALSLLALGCGDDADTKANNANNTNSESPVLAECAVRLDVSGEITGPIDLAVDEGCGGGRTNRATFVYGETSEFRVEIAIYGVEPGMTGNNIPATVSLIRNEDDAVWFVGQENCSADVTTNTPVDDPPLTISNISGVGRCDESVPASRESGEDTGVFFKDFEFSGSVLWI